MKRRDIALLTATLTGVALAALVGLGGSLLGVEDILLPVKLAGEGLRKLSLSGWFGNLLAWGIVFLVSTLPVLLTWRRWGQLEDQLLWPGCLCIAAGGLFLVNPTALQNPLRDLFPIMALGTALSLVLSWGVLRTLRWMEKAPEDKLREVFRRLFQVCALLLAAAASFGWLTGLLGEWGALKAGNTDGGGMLTLFTLLVLSLLRAVPDLLAAVTLMRGSELAASLGGERFEPVDVDLCRETARFCRLAVQAEVRVAAAANVLQLLFFEWLRESSFRLEFPLFSLALSAGLFLLCRLLERGARLQADSDSII